MNNAATAAIRDPTTGRIVGTRARSLQERYPTGRKHCSYCTRWRHLVDFGYKRGYPQSRCKVCRRRSVRQPGAGPRQPPKRVEYLKRRRQQWAEYIARIKADPERHTVFLEDHRIRQHDARRAKGVPERPRHAPKGGSYELVDAAPFLEWVQLNRPSLTDNEGRRVREAQHKHGRGEPANMSLWLIDQIMTRSGYPELVAAFYPMDD